MRKLFCLECKEEISVLHTDKEIIEEFKLLHSGHQLFWKFPIMEDDQDEILDSEIIEEQII